MESESGTPRPGSSHQPDALQTGKDFPFGLLPMQMCEDSGSDISGTEHLLLIGKHAQHRAAGSQPRALSAPWEPEPQPQRAGAGFSISRGQDVVRPQAPSPGSRYLALYPSIRRKAEMQEQQEADEETSVSTEARKLLGKKSVTKRENRKRQTGGSFTQHKQSLTFHLLPVYSPERSLFVIPHQKDGALQGSALRGFCSERHGSRLGRLRPALTLLSSVPPGEAHVGITAKGKRNCSSTGARETRPGCSDSLTEREIQRCVLLPRDQGLCQVASLPLLSVTVMRQTITEDPPQGSIPDHADQARALSTTHRFFP
ncbi:hypothetical protein MJT46_009028 [Ovis ammon polii x Ovis aries]|nr:hypothetical protein MJT46_009028 [Ovis ammon polii x Ovis aries]